DSVQWFRAEADMERWQEQLEIKHSEFLRLIASFTKHRDAWDLLMNHHSTTPGHQAYAREHRDMFDSLRIDAEEKYRRSAIPFLLGRKPGETLADRIIQWRREEEKLFKFDRWAIRPAFHDPTVFKHGGDTRVPITLIHSRIPGLPQAALGILGISLRQMKKAKDLGGVPGVT
ncbi:hypothetical protein F5878DRAFT_647165, partial [Lentinula raphanica]